jgi:hypothetical protein
VRVGGEGEREAQVADSQTTSKSRGVSDARFSFFPHYVRQAVGTWLDNSCSPCR